MSQFLTFDDVEDHVSWLPDDTLITLAAGPHETEDGSEFPDCRVCEALDRLDTMPVSERTKLHARDLRTWHEVLLGDLPEYIDVAHATNAPYDFEDLIEDTSARALRVYGELMGALSYARCCAIYAAARAQLANRRTAGGQIAA